jgi:hypothetical protein
MAGFFCLLLLTAPFSPVSAQELGRLFFTPEYREALDHRRQFGIQEQQERQEEASGDPALTIDGVVTRSSGKRTVWINGIARDDSLETGGVAVVPKRFNPGRVVVHPEGGPVAEIDVGDTIDPNTGETADLLGGGHIRIKTALPR